VDVVITHGRKIVSDEVRALTEEKVRHIGEHCPGLERAEVHFSLARGLRKGCFGHSVSLNQQPKRQS